MYQWAVGTVEMRAELWNYQTFLEMAWLSQEIGAGAHGWGPEVVGGREEVL